MILGDGIGAVDNIQLNSDLYVYGLNLMSGAALDLNGHTLYYFADKLQYGGVIGTGFVYNGTYSGGEIIEIIPEPSSIFLFFSSALPFLFTRKK